MKSRTGYIQYLQFVAGSNKGGVEQGDLFNDGFRLGEMNEDRINYTGATIVEEAKVAGATAWGKAGQVGCFALNDVSGDGTKEIFIDGKVLPEGKTKESECVAVANITVGMKYTYVYNNVVIPQNDIPQLVARVQGIELHAKARRIGIYYSQMAA